MEFLNSAAMKNAINKLLLIFIFYVVASASFNGFFMKWKFRDFEVDHSFEMMYDGTAERPYIYRQMMISVAKSIKSLIPEESQQNFINSFKPADSSIGYVYPKSFIAYFNTNTKIEPRFEFEYHIVYFMTLFFLFLSMFLWREIGIEVTKSPTAGTLAACCFAIIFPLFETVGGYYYDFGELFFLSLSTLLAIKGNWLAIILISPIAVYNKESFLFFIIALFPFLTVRFGNIKAATITAVAIIAGGMAYLYVSNVYIENLGGTTQPHFYQHLKYIFNQWADIEITYGTIFGAGMFLPHILMIAWIVKRTWKNLSETWKNHIKIMATINFPLYIMFCHQGEVRNFSLLYVGFIAMLSIFIKEAINIEQKK